MTLGKLAQLSIENGELSQSCTLSTATRQDMELAYVKLLRNFESLEASYASCLSSLEVNLLK